MDKQSWADRQKALAKGLAFHPQVLIGKEVVAVDLGGDIFDRQYWVDARVGRITLTFSDGTLATFSSRTGRLDLAITEGEADG